MNAEIQLLIGVFLILLGSLLVSTSHHWADATTAIIAWGGIVLSAIVFLVKGSLPKRP